MIKRRSPKRDELVDPARTILWLNLLSVAVGSCRAGRVQRTVLAQGWGREVEKSSRFSLYSKGKCSPNKAMIALAEKFLPGTAYVIGHVLWDVLRENLDISVHLWTWVERLPAEIQKAICSDDRKIEERVMTREMLLRRFGLDSLAALVILFRLNVAGVTTNWDPATSLAGSAYGYAKAILQTLVLMAADFPGDSAREAIFKLFVERIFRADLVGGFPMIDLETFDFSGRAEQLRFAAGELGVTIAPPLSRVDFRVIERQIVPYL